MTTTIVIPVHNGEALLSACLVEVVEQARQIDAQVLVVDDSSTDNSSAAAAAAGAEVLRLANPVGPYGARNEGWRAALHDQVVFIDVRSRARPGWLAALLRGLETPGTAITGGEVRVLPGRRLAERAAARMQPMLASRDSEAMFLPYVPTCCLATSRAVLAAVGGFEEVRGGGDVDLCWRVQLAGLGAVRLVAGAEMDWVPRPTVAELLAQYRRYGMNSRWLQQRFGPSGCRVDPPVPAWRAAAGCTRATLRDLVASPPRRWAEIAVEGLSRHAAIAGHRTGPVIPRRNGIRA